MSDRRRFYLTTAIAYANNRPGPAHALRGRRRRRHRALAPHDRRRHALPDRHGRVLRQHRHDGGRSAASPPKAFVDEMVALFRTAEDALGISPDRFIRTTDPDHAEAVHEMIRRAHANGDIYLGDYEGWYCPNEGFRNTSDLIEDAAGFHCPNHPDVDLQWLTRAQLVLPPLRLPGAPRAPLRRASATGSSRSTAATRCSASSAGPRGLLGQPRGRHLGHPVPAPARRHPRRAEPTARGTPRREPCTSGTTRSSTTSPAPASRPTPSRLRALVAGRPARHRQGHQPAPHHLLAGHAHERRAAAAAQGLGPRLAAGAGRADEQEPRQLPRPASTWSRRSAGTARATRCCARSPSTATATSRGTASCAATTRTSPTTSATS